MKISCFFAVFLISLAVHAEWVTLSIQVDGIFIGDVPVDIQPDGSVTSIGGAEFVNLLEPYLMDEKIQRIKKLMQPDQSLRIEDLNRIGIASVYSEKELDIVLTIPMEMRLVKDFPMFMKRGKAGLSLYNKDFSGYFNYSFLAGFTAKAKPTERTNRDDPKEGFFELVQNFSFFTLESTANYREFEAKAFQRADSSLVHDFEYAQIRSRVGDFFSPSHAFQTSLPNAGLQVQKQFSIYPERGSLNKRSAIVQVKRNSVMEIYVNEVLLSRFRVEAGPYNIKDIPTLYGRNKVKVILVDDFGSRETFEIDLFFDDQILAKGVHNFSYGVGVPSYYVLNEKFYYPDVFGSFFHQYGMSDQLTISANYQNYQTTRLMGAGFGYLSDFGTNVFDYAYFTDKDTNAGNAEKWRFGSPDINNIYISQLRVLASAEFKSKEFKSISAVASQAPTYSEKYDFVLQKYLGGNSTGTAGITKIVGQNGFPNDLARRIGLQSQFSRNWILDINYNWMEQQSTTDQVQATLTWTESQDKSIASLSHSSQNNSTSIRLAKDNIKPYEDFRLAVLATKLEPSNAPSSQQLDFAQDYFGRAFESRFRVLGNSTEAGVRSTAQFGFGSALAWTTDGMAISRHISDAFAIVAPQGLTGDNKLSVPNGTDKDVLYLKNDEDFVYSNLTSYHNNNLQLNSTELRNGYHLDRESYIIIPNYRSGVFMPLKVDKALVVTGFLKSDVEEWHKYAYGKIWTKEQKLQSSNFFTDETGKFVLEGLPPGQYQIELSDPRLKRINIEIKDSEGVEINLGEIPIEKMEGM